MASPWVQRMLREQGPTGRKADVQPEFTLGDRVPADRQPRFTLTDGKPVTSLLPEHDCACCGMREWLIKVDGTWQCEYCDGNQVCCRN